MRHFRAEDKLARSSDLLSTELDEETVLMSIDAGAYYGMAGSARDIWDRLAIPLTFSDLVDELVNEYETTSEACANDLQVFLNKLEQEGLLRVE
jgi:hypothetical protein